jgi:hypothetical protein
MTTPERDARKDQILSPSRTFFSPEKFPYCFTYLAKRKPAGAKEAAEKLCFVSGHDFSRAVNG